MSFRIFSHPKAKEGFDKLDAGIRDRVKKRIKELENFPKKGKHLKRVDFWSLRVGDHRVIYEIDTGSQKVIVLFIGHRKHVYDEVSRLF